MYCRHLHFVLKRVGFPPRNGDRYSLADSIVLLRLHYMVWLHKMDWTVLPLFQLILNLNDFFFTKLLDIIFICFLVLFRRNLNKSTSLCKGNIRDIKNLHISLEKIWARWEKKLQFFYLIIVANYKLTFTVEVCCLNILKCINPCCKNISGT